MTWTCPEVIGSPPSARRGHSVAIVGKCMYVFGGFDGYRHMRDLHVLSVEGRDFVWSQPPTGGEVPSPRRYHAMVTIGSHLMIYGGFDGENYLDDAYTYDTERRLWRRWDISKRMEMEEPDVMKTNFGIPNSGVDGRSMHTLSYDGVRAIAFGGVHIHGPQSDVIFLENSAVSHGRQLQRVYSNFEREQQWRQKQQILAEERVARLESDLVQMKATIERMTEALKSEVKKRHVSIMSQRILARKLHHAREELEELSDSLTSKSKEATEASGKISKTKEHIHELQSLLEQSALQAEERLVTERLARQAEFVAFKEDVDRLASMKVLADQESENLRLKTEMMERENEELRMAKRKTDAALAVTEFKVQTLQEEVSDAAASRAQTSDAQVQAPVKVLDDCQEEYEVADLRKNFEAEQDKRRKLEEKLQAQILECHNVEQRYREAEEMKAEALKHATTTEETYKDELHRLEEKLRQCEMVKWKMECRIASLEEENKALSYYTISKARCEGGGGGGGGGEASGLQIPSAWR
ncbi:hypothetical protein CBR_g54444 [Chara braunii]|uniref:DUF4110 domain-containing protein n=1 Tax=Chara braunii TaxID=69332 RepID=A0A388MCA8_CHABU|nr:hypothetical protein CBR_g54444 [Chara braunii]|eukprot:GBG92143.1 hypothetical protein CBR_g54444 [Chara braunii]